MLAEALKQEIGEVLNKYHIGLKIENIQINDNSLYSQGLQDWPKKTKKVPEIRGTAEFVISFYND